MENLHHYIGLWHFKETCFHLWDNHLPGDFSQIRLKKNGIWKQHFWPKTQVIFTGLPSGLVKVIFSQKRTQLPECTRMLSGINLRPSWKSEGNLRVRLFCLAYNCSITVGRAKALYQMFTLYCFIKIYFNLGQGQSLWN